MIINDFYYTMALKKLKIYKIMVFTQTVKRKGFFTYDNTLKKKHEKINLPENINCSQYKGK